MIHNTSGVERTELSKLKIGDYIKMQIIKDKNGIYTLIGKDETEEGSHSFGVFDFIKYKRGKLVSDRAMDGRNDPTSLGIYTYFENSLIPTGLITGDRNLSIPSYSEAMDLSTYTFNDTIDSGFILKLGNYVFPVQESHYTKIPYWTDMRPGEYSGWHQTPDAMILIYDYVDNPNSENIYY